MEEELRAEIEFLEDKIIGLERKNEELLGAINRLKYEHEYKAKQEARFIVKPQSAYDYYRPTYNWATNENLGQAQQGAAAGLAQQQAAINQQFAAQQQAMQDAAVMGQGIVRVEGNTGGAGLQGGLQNRQDAVITTTNDGVVHLTVDMIQNAFNMAANPPEFQWGDVMDDTIFDETF